MIICTEAGELEIIVLSEINQSQTSATYFLSDAESVFKEQNTRKWRGARGSRSEEARTGPRVTGGQTDKSA